MILSHNIHSGFCLPRQINSEDSYPNPFWNMFLYAVCFIFGYPQIDVALTLETCWYIYIYTYSINIFLSTRPLDQCDNIHLLRHPRIAVSAASRLPPNKRQLDGKVFCKRKLHISRCDVSMSVYIYYMIVCMYVCVSILKDPSSGLYCSFRVEQKSIVTFILPNGSFLCGWI